MNRSLIRYPSSPYEQDADEGMKKMEVLGCWLQRERVDRNALLAQAKFDMPAPSNVASFR